MDRARSGLEPRRKTRPDAKSSAVDSTVIASSSPQYANGRRGRASRLFLDAGLVAGGALAIAALVVLIRADGGLAYDTRAYWLAARHVVDGASLYSPATVSDLGAYKYPPLFAQLAAPIAYLPELLVAWIWRATGVLCLRYLAGSWKAAIVACAFFPVLIELSLGNVTLQIGAVLLFALRDRRGAYLLPWAAAMKFGPVLLVPYLWFRMPESRRPLIVGTAVFLAACLGSYLIAPGQWSGYADTFGWENASVMLGSGVIAIVPAWGGLDFVLRFAAAGAVALYAAYSRRDWLAYAAASITCPILAFSRFAPWVGLWRFRRTAGRVAASNRDAGAVATGPAAAVSAP
jgi:hypothetical protein